MFINLMRFRRRNLLKKWWKIVLATFMGFINDNGLKLSASLAYYTVFSIAPLIILIISITSLVLHHYNYNDTLYADLAKFMGKDAVDQLQQIVTHLQLSGKTGTALIIGIVILLLGASSMFVEIQDSLNIIWRVRSKPKRGWLKWLQNRFLSFSLIIALGFLLLVSLILNIAINAISERLQRFFPVVTVTLFDVINLFITFVVIAILFSIIFKFLPDVKIKWRDVRSGAIFTALLFLLGQYLISLYLRYTAQGSAYGAAGSLIVLLVWIYYTSAILYIGAEFTEVYAEATCSTIEPAEYAVHVIQTEVEHEVDELPPQNPELAGKLKKPEEK
ncbi:MAG TPA: YihY/virulence factor BrkB family protein [Mucilaginibacter sp.]|nr:YihY/virulence factor BrkB family protein [Mucilaginibacter sp.]